MKQEMRSFTKARRRGWLRQFNFRKNVTRHFRSALMKRKGKFDERAENNERKGKD